MLSYDEKFVCSENPGKLEILEKSPICVETKTNVQTPFQNLHFGNNSKERCKSRGQTFLFLSSFLVIIYFVPNIFTGIVD